MLRNLAVTSVLPTREEEYQGRKHLVIPVVALVEGVVQAMNASNPEFVDAEEFSKWPGSWNGRPVFLNHPTNGSGSPISGNTPELISKQAIGVIFNAGVKDNKLTMEAWVDIEKAEKVAPEILTRIAEGDAIEISIGAFAETDTSTGVYNGKKYKGAWHDIVPDHLALLGKGHKGACSRDMGCGVRAAEMRACIIKKEGNKWVLYSHDGEKLGTHDTKAEAEAQEKAIKSRKYAEGNVTTKKDKTFGTIFARMMSAFRSTQPAADMSSSDLGRKLSDELRKVEPYFNYVETYHPVTNPNRVVYSCYIPETSMGYPVNAYGLFERQFNLSDSGVVSIGESRVEVEPVVSYEPLALEADTKDAEKIQAMHNHALSLGAQCAPKTAEGKPCGCQETKALSQETDMNKEAITKFLETATPEQITVLGATIEGTNPAVKAAQDAQAKAEADLKAAQDKAAADVKAASDKAAADAKAAQEDPEYVAFKAAQAAKKEATIKALKATGRCKMTDEQLASKTQVELDQLVELAGAPKAAVDFGGAGAAKDTDSKKSAPEAPGLAALAGKKA